MFTKALALLALVAYANCVTFDVVNNSGSQKVYIQTLGSATVAPFTLNAKEKKTLTFGATWSGRIWGRVDCFTAADCSVVAAAPSSLFELTYQDNNAWYDLSLVDGFNIPVSVAPVGGHPDGTQYRCQKAVCAKNLLTSCPSELILKNKAGTVIGCQAACNVFNTDLYCCRGAHNTPQTCRDTDWPVDYAKFFKDACPDAYSYAYDDQKSTFTCDSDHYTVSFL